MENHREEFIKPFDALEEGASEGVFAAIEAAFDIGESMAATRFRKEVPPIHMKNDLSSHARKERAKKPRNPEVVKAIKATREAMKANRAPPNGGLSYARLIPRDVVERPAGC